MAARRARKLPQDRLPDEDVQATLDPVLQRFDFREDGLMEALTTAQAAFGFLSPAVLEYVARRLDVPLSKVYGVATFYHLYTLEEPGAGQRCLVCTDPACRIAGAEAVLAAVHQVASEPSKDLTVKRASCLGLCDQAPAVLVNDQAFVQLTAESVPALLSGHVPQPRLQVTGEPRVITRWIGELDPLDLEAHRARGAFKAFEKALNEMTVDAIIAEIKASGLAGRGGAGFPTGLKWEFTRHAAGTTRYVVCNFDESEPGTFKDRVLMTGDPFRTLEGLLINAYVIGAHQGYIFIRGEYPEAAQVVQEALDRLYAANLLGEHILGTDFSCDVEIRRGAGAYICGEETALFEAIEGHRGYPRTKPPFPTTHGLFGQPTSINNVETLAIVPDILLNGSAWWRQWGTEKSVGMKLFCLSGHVGQPGVVEAPYGLTVRELIERYGGGFEGEPQAILMGGAAGGLMHPDHLDTPLTHEALNPLGTPIGSGVIMVFNQDVDLLDVLRSLAHFFMHESCGQCLPCRVGTRRMVNLLDKIIEGRGTGADLDQIRSLSHTMKTTSLCGLGQTAPNTVMTSLNYFQDVYQSVLRTGASLPNEGRSSAT